MVCQIPPAPPNLIFKALIYQGFLFYPNLYSHLAPAQDNRKT